MSHYDLTSLSTLLPILVIIGAILGAALFIIYMEIVAVMAIAIAELFVQAGTMVLGILGPIASVIATPLVWFWWFVFGRRPARRQLRY
ncbi:MAG TPA: hypothetical protein VEB18_02565 [Candidatus Paceibacterota bacterium]|nr:hypothetical protein [Candidatus Paceibacterota bacterium]